MENVRTTLPSGIEVLDVDLFGCRELSCSYLVHAAEPALIETGPATVFETVRDALTSRNIEPRHVVLTHIHLDHGGGAGHVSELFPNATVWVHEVGAPHVADPDRLVASARRLFGDALESLWGVPEPVPGHRVRAMGEGDVIGLGDRELRVLYTPGHARHEVTLWEPDARVAFLGDTAGICFAEGYQKPATPPPEFDLVAAVESIERVKGLRAEAVCFTHYGPAREPALDRAAADLMQWDGVLRPLVERGASDEELGDAIARVTGAFPGDDRYQAAAAELSSVPNSVAGYVRYYRKRAESR